MSVLLYRLYRKSYCSHTANYMAGGNLTEASRAAGSLEQVRLKQAGDAAALSLPVTLSGGNILREVQS